MRTYPTPEWFREHETLDEARFVKIEEGFNSIHDRLDQVPTQEDLRLVLTAIKNIQVGVGFVRISGRTALWIVSIGGAGIVLFRYWKYALLFLMNIKP